MVRLTFNEDFTNIEDEITNIWKNEEDIPDNIKEFINDIYSQRVIYVNSEEKYYCSECLKELDSNLICSKCNKKYNNINDKYLIKVKDFKNIDNYHDYSYYYIFQLYGSSIVLYCIEENICYKNNLTIYPIKMRKIKVNNAYLVSRNGLKDLINNKYTSYDKIADMLYEEYYDYQFINDNFNRTEETGHTSSFLYLDNLEELKNTIYKYVPIWETKEYLKDNCISYEHLTYFPLATKYFEYLIKSKYYNIAYTRPDEIEFDSFIKKHIKFIDDNRLNLDEINTLRMLKEENLEEIKKIGILSYTLIFLEEEYGVKALKIKEYFDKNNINYEYIHEYYDYLYFARENGMNMKDKNVLFPKNLMEEHDKAYKEHVILEDPKIESRIKDISKMLSINTYEDDKYIIYPANSIESLIDESEQQNNCVRTYCKRYSNNECQIYFMRYKETKDKSLVTIEVKNGEVIQARTKYNELPDKDLMNVINNWEGKLVLVSNE